MEHGYYYLMPIGHKVKGNFEDVVVGLPFTREFVSGSPSVVFRFPKKQLAQARKIRFESNGRDKLDIFAPAEVLLDVYKYLGDGMKLLLVIAYASILIVIISIFLSG